MQIYVLQHPTVLLPRSVLHKSGQENCHIHACRAVSDRVWRKFYKKGSTVRKNKTIQQSGTTELFSYSTLKKTNKLSDLTTRIIFTLIVLLIIRVGSNIPIPGLDSDVFSKWFSEKFSSTGGFFNVMTGGSFSNMSILALNITPIITASIITQFASIIIHPLERLLKDEDGQKMMAQITRYGSITIAFAEGILFSFSFLHSGYFKEDDALAAFSMVFTIVAGTAVMLWFSDLLSEYGVGNGITVILVADILFSIPSDFTILYNRFVANRTGLPFKFLSVLCILAVICLIIIYVVVMQECEHRFPVQGSRGTSNIFHMNETLKRQNYIPMKLNSAGVMPIIFAQAILQAPTLLSALGFDIQKGLFNFIALSSVQKNWFNPYYPEYSFGIIIYMAVIILFFCFYANISFNPDEIADYLRETGGTIPGVRPGIETAQYLKKSATAMNFIGACALGIVSLVPIFISSYFDVELSLGGTSLIIIVGGITEIVQQICAEKYKQRLVTY